MRSKIIGIAVLAGMLLFFANMVVKAQDVRVIRDKTTYGLDGKVLERICLELIDQKLSDLKTQSGRVLANVKLVGMDHKKGSLDFQVVVTFLLKETYTAKVKQINFSLVGGKTTNVTILEPEPIKIKQVKKEAVPMDYKTKQKIHITPDGTLRMVAMKPKTTVSKKKASEFSTYNWWYAKGLADTPCDNISCAVNSTKNVFSIFEQAFGSGTNALRLGSQATLGEITDFLKYDGVLMAWNNIGHGNVDRIVLWDGSLTAADIQELNPFSGLFGSVVLLNSCYTFNDPLKTAFLGKNPRTYIAGILALPICKSESVDVCFWNGVLLENVRMDKELADCSAKYGLTGYFGLAGDGGLFW
jgi:hypothetical protein